MNEKPTLLILAAGIGSRYGSLKQVDPVGPGGETIMDYSVFDAIRSGFGKVVFVIRKDIEDDFREQLFPRYGNRICIDFVHQEIDKVPAGTLISAERMKPWGTGHAVLVANEKIQEPFAVINADDFYGYEAFRQMASYLNSPAPPDHHEAAMAGYLLDHTLSEHGTVSRGVCKEDKEHNLLEVTEMIKIGYIDGKITSTQQDGSIGCLPGNTVVSMNFWGFRQHVFSLFEQLFTEFIRVKGTDPKAEFYLSTAVDHLIKKGLIRVRILHTAARWFGVTYREDKPLVMEKVATLVNSGVYPANLWK